MALVAKIGGGEFAFIPVAVQIRLTKFTPQSGQR